MQSLDLKHARQTVLNEMKMGLLYGINGDTHKSFIHLAPSDSSYPRTYCRFSRSLFRFIFIVIIRFLFV